MQEVHAGNERKPLLNSLNPKPLNLESGRPETMGTPINAFGVENTLDKEGMNKSAAAISTRHGPGWFRVYGLG